MRNFQHVIENRKQSYKIEKIITLWKSIFLDTVKTVISNKRKFCRKSGQLDFSDDLRRDLISVRVQEENTEVRSRMLSHHNIFVFASLYPY